MTKNGPETIKNIFFIFYKLKHKGKKHFRKFHKKQKILETKLHF
jgi:hypothetical protein